MRYFLLSLVAVFLAASQVAGRGEFRLGGEDGTPWSAALGETAGEYLLFDSENSQIGALEVGTTPYGAGVDTLIDFSGTAILPRFIDPTINMAITDPESASIKIPLPYIGGQALTTDGCAAEAQQIPAVKLMFDNDVTTAHFRRFTQNPDALPGIGEGWGRSGSAAAVVDLGAAVPVNRLRFYPRLGQEDDEALINNLVDPKPELTAFGPDSFIDNFLNSYEIRVQNNAQAFARSPCDGEGFNRGLSWVRPGDKRLKVLVENRENLKPIVDLRFPTQPIRWITVRPFPLRNWEIAEFEIYGEGFVTETIYTTQVLDFGKLINWGKIRWSGEAPKGTRVEIRTRTGQSPDPNIYFAENINGDIRQVSLDKFEEVTLTARLPTGYNVEDWSFWSPPYDFKAGLRDVDQPAEQWNDGIPLLSPGPSRYIQLTIRLFSTFKQAPRIDQLTLQFGEAPAARQVLGEVWPIEVTSFEPETFTYVVRPTFDAEDAGFDRLEILTHSRATAVHSIQIDGSAVDLTDFPVDIQDDRIITSFPKLHGEADSFKQLEVVFDVSVLRFGTQFSSWVFNSDDPDRIKQRIAPGNATFRFSADDISVRAPVGGDLLIDVRAEPSVFTPNGDGVNDKLVISYKLREVTAERPITVKIYDLMGRLATELPVYLVRSGEFQREWDGRNASGQVMPPGTYIFQLALEAEEKEQYMGLISIAY